MTGVIHLAFGDTEWPHLACGAEATSWQPQSTREPADVTCARCKATQRYRQAAKLAAAVQAHADAALDEHFPLRNPCLLCGVPGMPQRHRVIDAIAGGLSAGEDGETLADEYDVPLPAVQAVSEWMARWPGAWE